MSRRSCRHSMLIFAFVGFGVSPAVAAPPAEGAPGAPPTLDRAAIEALLARLSNAERTPRSGRDPLTRARSDGGGHESPRRQESSNDGSASVDPCDDCDQACITSGCAVEHCDCGDIVVIGIREPGAADPCAAPCDPARCPSGCGPEVPVPTDHASGGGEDEDEPAVSDEVNTDCSIDCFSQAVDGWAPPRSPSRQCADITRPPSPDPSPPRATTKAIEDKIPTGRPAPNATNTIDRPPPPIGTIQRDVVTGTLVARPNTVVDWGCAGVTVPEDTACRDPNIYFGECHGATYYMTCQVVDGEEQMGYWSYVKRTVDGACTCGLKEQIPEDCV